MGLTDEVRRNAREIAERARFVSIDLGRLGALDPGPPPETHFIAGSAEEVAHFVLVLDSINFGSGWFPTLRKRPGMSGYRTVASSMADFWRSSGGWSVEKLRALRASDVAAGMRFYDDAGFWKRAQIVPYDLSLAGVADFHDLDRLTIFADNLVPHVLRVEGVLRYDPALAARIDAGELLPPGDEEREVRACAVHACELLSE